METYRPVDWLPEWHKTSDMTEVGENPALLRGGRFRFYNGIEKDIMIEEVVYDIKSNWQYWTLITSRLLIWQEVLLSRENNSTNELAPIPPVIRIPATKSVSSHKERFRTSICLGHITVINQTA